METFDFTKKEKVKTIDYGLLQQSAKLLDASRMPPRNRPLEHYELIDQVGTLLDKNSLDVTLQDIWVSYAGARFSESASTKQADGDIDRWHFNRLVTMYKINNEANDNDTGAVAIGYTENGIQIAWGTQVNICQNMSIFGNWVISTYGKNSIQDLAKIFTILNAWAQRFSIKREFDHMIFNEMSTVDFGELAATNAIGELYTNAVHNVIDKKIEAPLNTDQISAITKMYIKEPNKDNISLYDFYNYGTNTLNPGAKKIDISVIYDRNQMFGLFLLNMFGIRQKIEQDQRFDELLYHNQL